MTTKSKIIAYSIFFALFCALWLIQGNDLEKRRKEIVDNMLLVPGVVSSVQSSGTITRSSWVAQYRYFANGRIIVGSRTINATRANWRSFNGKVYAVAYSSSRPDISYLLMNKRDSLDYGL